MPSLILSVTALEKKYNCWRAKIDEFQIYTILGLSEFLRRGG